MIVSVQVNVGNSEHTAGLDNLSAREFVIVVDGMRVDDAPTFPAALQALGRQLRQLLSPAQKDSGITWSMTLTACGITVRPLGRPLQRGGFMGGGVPSDLDRAVGRLLEEEPESPFEAVALILRVADVICDQRLGAAMT